jgi:hypothetical protein
MYAASLPLRLHYHSPRAMKYALVQLVSHSRAQVAPALSAYLPQWTKYPLKRSFRSIFQQYNITSAPLTVSNLQTEMNRSVATNAKSVACCCETIAIHGEVTTKIVPSRTYTTIHPRLSICRLSSNLLPADSCGEPFLPCMYWSACTKISLSAASTRLVSIRESFQFKTYLYILLIEDKQIDTICLNLYRK